MEDLRYSQLKAICKKYDLSPREFKSALDRGDYSLISYQDAETQASDYIKESVWTFNVSFLFAYTGIDSSVFELLQDKCEDANDAVLSLIRANGGIADFIEHALQVDGIGHFVSSYDGEHFEVPNSDLITFRIN